MISVIIPAYNAAATIRRCVKAIRDAGSAPVEVIVVDDASTDDTAVLAEVLADTVVHQVQRSGAGAARNLGRSYATGDLLVFVDADVEARPGSLDRLLAGLGDADAAFGSYSPLPPPGIRNRVTMYKNHMHHVTHQSAGSHVATFWSGFGVVRAVRFDAVGGFPERREGFADVEDIGLGYALSGGAASIAVVPEAQVDHHKRFSVGSLVVTDLRHRAMPWAETILRTRTFRPELAISVAAIVSSVAAWVMAIAATLAVTGPIDALRAIGVLGGAMLVWLMANRRFLLSASHAFRSGSAILAATALHLLFSWYAPIGAVLGVGAFVLRRSRGQAAALARPLP